MKKIVATLVFGASILTASLAQSATILISGSSIVSFEVDGSSYTTFNSILSTGNTLDFVADMSDATQVAAADALFVTTRSSTSVLSTSEIANITAFINSGKRVYFGGENAGWTIWNNSFLALVGGAQGASVTGTQTPVVTNALTAGISSVNVPAGSGTATGGTSLFSGNFANLWGSSANVLTLQDANMFQNNFITLQDNERFAENVAAWLSEDVAPVPVPASLPLLFAGFGCFALLRGRKRAAAA